MNEQTRSIDCGCTNDRQQGERLPHKISKKQR